jgi:hypothetical protein
MVHPPFADIEVLTRNVAFVATLLSNMIVIHTMGNRDNDPLHMDSRSEAQCNTLFILDMLCRFRGREYATE